METKQIRRADEFAIHSRISVDGVPSMANMRLEAITNSAVYVLKDGVQTTISCGSPCFASDEEIIKAVMDSGPVVLHKEPKIETSIEKVEVVKEKTGKPGRPQGVQGKIIADKLATFVFPSEPFTIKQVVELTGIDQLHLISFIDKNCRCVGEEPKIQGKRGRLAKLYLKK